MSKPNKTAQQRIERAHYAIMKNANFCVWSGLLFMGKWTIDDKIPTACVNAAGDVKYGRAFIDSLEMSGANDPYVNYVVLHENGHKALMHLTRGKEFFKANPMAANLAADHVVNNMIEDIDPTGTFAKMPVDAAGKRIGVCDPKYKGKSMKEVFNDIMKNPPPGGWSSGNGSGGMDEHDPTGEDGQELTKEQLEAIEQAVDQALRNGAYLAGKLGGNANRLLGDMLEPKIDWEEQLAEFVMEVCQGDDNSTWRRPMRRFVGEDIYMPSSYQETVGEMLFAIDVSGSVGNQEMTACLSEVVEAARVVRPSKLHLWYWDDGIRRREEYTPEQYDEIVSLTRPTGGGGTDVGEVAAEANKMKDLQCAIILTDGYIGGGWRQWNMPVLWVLTTKNMVADCGKSLHIDV